MICTIYIVIYVTNIYITYKQHKCIAHMQSTYAKLSPVSTRAQMHKHYIDYLTCYLQPMIDVLNQVVNPVSDSIRGL